MAKTHLTQVKLFPVLSSEMFANQTEKKVNDFIIEIFNKTGNYPSVETNSAFITVIYSELCEVNYGK